VIHQEIYHITDNNIITWVAIRYSFRFISKSVIPAVAQQSVSEDGGQARQVPDSTDNGADPGR
jgi:hypothetical protein